jgi:hypothetical protein
MFLIQSARDCICPMYFYNEAFWNVCWILCGLIKISSPVCRQKYDTISNIRMRWLEHLPYLGDWKKAYKHAIRKTEVVSQQPFCYDCLTWQKLLSTTWLIVQSISPVHTFSDMYLLNKPPSKPLILKQFSTLLFMYNSMYMSPPSCSLIVCFFFLHKNFTMSLKLSLKLN